MKRESVPLRTTTLIVSALLGILALSSCSEDGVIYVDRPEVFNRERLINRRLAEQSWLEAQLTNMPEFSLQGLEEVNTFAGLYGKASAQFDPLGGLVDTARQAQNLQAVQRNAQLDKLRADVAMAALQRQLEAVKASTNVTATPTSVSTSNLAVDNNAGGTSLALADSVSLPNSPALPSAANITPTQAKLTSIESLRDKLAYRNSIVACLREQELDDTHDLNGSTLYTLKFDVTIAPGSDNNKLGQVKIQIQPEGDYTPRVFEKWMTAFQEDLRAESLSLQRRLKLHQLSETEEFELAALSLPVSQQAEEERGELLNHAWRSQDSLYQAAVAIDATRRSKLGQGNPFASDVDGRSVSTGTSSNISELIQETPLSVSSVKQMLQMGITSEKLQRLAFLKEEHKKAQRGLNNNDVKRDALEGLQRELASREYSTASFMAVCYLLKHRYETTLGKFVTISDPLPVKFSDGVKYFELGVQAKQNGFDEFVTAMNDKDRHRNMFVYSVEPKEYAQNISEVAAHEHLLNVVLALRALVPQLGGTGDAYLKVMRGSETLLHGIQRKPLVIGYVNGTNEFGWMLGPRFKLQGGKATFEHTVVQQTVQASLVLPAWWQSMKLRSSWRWIDDDEAPELTQTTGTNSSGSRRKPKAVQNNTSSLSPDSVEDKASKADTDSTAQTLIINLPGDMSSLTRNLTANQASRRPYIEPRWSPVVDQQKILVRVGRQENVLIRGRDLWRNPAVFIGSQRARAVSVLPDMNGLVATFDPLDMPAKFGSATPCVDLTVVTSGGVSTLRDAVSILPKEGETAPKPSLKMQTIRAACINANSTVTNQVSIVATGQSLPDGFYGLKLRVRPKGQSLWADCNSTPRLSREDSGVMITSLLDFQNQPWKTNGAEILSSNAATEMQADLRIQPRRTDMETSVSDSGVEGSFVLFYNAEEAKAKLDTNATPGLTLGSDRIDGSNIVLTLSTNLFFKAYPGLEDAVNSKFTLCFYSTNAVPSNTVASVGAMLSLVSSNSGSVASGKTFKAEQVGPQIRLIIQPAWSSSEKNKDPEIEHLLGFLKGLPSDSAKHEPAVVRLAIEYQSGNRLQVLGDLPVMTSSH